MKSFIKGLSKFALCLTIVFMTLSIGLATKSPSNYVYAAEGDVTVDETTFPDATFRQWVLDNITSGSTTLTATMITNTTTIDVSSKNIASLKGIEYFTELNTLWCYRNQLTALDVSKNTKLETLVCYRNQLATLDVRNNPLLEQLSCAINQLTSLDVSNNPELQYLYCGGNKLTTLDVSKNQKLSSLACEVNQLTSLDVSKNPELQSLDCYSNQLTALDLSQNTALDSTRVYLSFDYDRNAAYQIPVFVAKKVGNKYVVNLKQNNAALKAGNISELVSNGTYDSAAATITYDTKPAATEKITYKYKTDGPGEEIMRVEGSIAIDNGTVTNTADNNGTLLYTTLFLISLIGVSGMVVYTKRKN